MNTSDNTNSACKISVAIIGKSGHASRLISIVKAMKDLDLRYVYYPKKLSVYGLPITNDFNKVIECDAVIVASPTFTHAHYLDKLRKFSGYILVEKPAVSTEQETIILRSYPNSIKEKIKVNFNLQHSKMADILHSLIIDSRLGRPIIFNVHTSHGLAFMEKYADSWRSARNCSMGVLELVGTHYINLAVDLFGPINEFNIHYSWGAKKTHNIPPDTVSLSLKMVDGVLVNLYHSYAGPYFNKILFVSANGYFDYDGSKYGIHSPRETFDHSNRFISPPCIDSAYLDYSLMWEASLKNSLRDFFDVVKVMGKFPVNKFESALNSANPIFCLRKMLENNINKGDTND